MVALPVVNQIPVPSGNHQSPASEIDELPDDSELGLFGGLLVAASAPAETTPTQTDSATPTLEVEATVPDQAVVPLAAAASTLLNDATDALTTEPPALAIEPPSDFGVEQLQPVDDAELAGQQIEASGATGVIDELPELPIGDHLSVVDATEATSITDEFAESQTGLTAAQLAASELVDEPELEEVESLSVADEANGLVREPIRDISAQLQIISNKTEATLDVSSVGHFARSTDRKAEPESLPSTEVTGATDLSSINTEAGIAANTDSIASTELYASTEIADLPPTHGLRKLTSELIAEAPDVVDSKTISVRFEEPHIGRVQLEMTESANGITVNVAASDEVTLEMLTANAASLERTLRDHQIELLEIASLPMDTATYNTAQGDQQFHRDSPPGYPQASTQSSNQRTSIESELEGPEQLNFRA